MKHLKRFENNTEEYYIENILTYFPEFPDNSKLPKNFFKVGDYAFGNIHISKAMDGSFLKQTIAKNNSMCLILRVYRVYSKEQHYNVKFFNKIPDYTDFPLNVLNKNNQIQLLSGRYLRMPSKKEFLKFINDKKSSMNYNDFIVWLKKTEQHIIESIANKYNI